MSEEQLEALRYPIGRFQWKESLTAEEREALLDDLATQPTRVRQAVEGLSEEQLDTPYRPDGWTVRQVVHHVADSHLNSYVRFKWATTEDNPAIKTYDQVAWAELADGSAAPVDQSLDLLDALHGRWVAWLRTFGPNEWERTFQHPKWSDFGLEPNLQLYGWHGNHHLAHISGLKERMGWD